MTATLERPTEDEPEGSKPSPVEGRRFRPTPGGWAGRAAVPVGLLLIALWYTHHFSQGRSDILASGLVIAVGALSLNVLVGYVGQISLGHQAFIGIGSFTASYVIGQSGQSFYVGLLAGAAVGGLQAILLGLIALRVRGLYFALVTLSWGAVAENCIFRLKGFTGGGEGANASRPGGFITDRAFLVMCALVLTVVLLIDWRLVSTKAGRAFQAIRESPQVAANYGINVRLYTLYAFAVAGVYAGIAGALYASRRITVQAGDFTFASIALTYLIVTVVGGLRRRGGIVLFSLFYVLGGEYLPGWVRGLPLPGTLKANAGYLVQAISGVLAIVTLIFQPEGLGTFTAPMGRWLKGERFALGHGGAG
ncbi:MAG: branched-chain amino acid transport system permease protein, partial [Acidimicrobiaceae bacterium]|nr:branched-chain amino acid transport system permease protein [Acidimicrobiaceae bacterium]